MGPGLARGEMLQDPDYAGIYAMVARGAEEQERRYAFITAHSGNQFSPPMAAPLKDAVIMAQTAYLLGAMRGVTEFGYNKYAEASICGLDDEAIAAMIGVDLEDMEDADSEMARALMTDGIIATLDIAGVGNLDSPIDLYESAKEMASKHGIAVDTVFQVEELYAEWVRHIYTPAKYVEGVLNIAQNITGNSMADMIIKQFQNVYRMEIERTGEDYSGELQELEQEALEMRSDTEFMGRVEESVAKAKHAIAKFCQSELARFWGEDVYETLPQTLRQRVEGLIIADSEAQQPNIADVGGVAVAGADEDKEAL